MTPHDRKYTKDHEWIQINGSRAAIGISDYAQSSMSDIVYVELPNVGDSFSAGSSFAVVESVKAASEIFTQVTGRVVEVNEALADAPETLNSDPYGAFIAIFDIQSVDEGALLSAEEYEAYIGE